MSSQIDNQNIDSTYPVAGKDNDSQGFRDNFAAIKSNFTFAKSELEDLQSKVILKAALDGGTLNNDLGGSNISNGTHTNFHGTSYSQTVSTSADIDVRNGGLQVFTVTDNSSLTFKHWPATGKYANVRIHLKSNGSVINVGDSVIVGKRYTIDTVENTNFVTMGATPTATFTGSITGNVLTVEAITGGSLAVNMTVIGGAAGTTIQGFGSGQGGTGTYIVSIGTQSVASTQMYGVTSGIVFTATTKGSGNGTVKPWREVELINEGGTVTPDSEFVLPILLNPNRTEQVIEAWTYTGDTTKAVYLNYIGNLDTAEVNYSILNIGTVNVQSDEDSTSSTSGAIVVSGGLGVAKNLNVGGNVLVEGDLTVNGASVLTTSSVSIADINDIQNVNINNLRNGDTLKYSTVSSTWTNNVDLIQHGITIADNGSGTQAVFFVDQVALSTSAGAQTSGLTDFKVGKKYRFNQTDGSNQNYDLRFSTTPDTIVNPDSLPGTRTITPYTTGVTVNGSAGYSNTSPYTEISITEETPSPLYLYAVQKDGGLKNDPSKTIGVFVIIGTSGQFTCSSITLDTNQPVKITGTWAGTGSIFGYVNGGNSNIYYIAAGGTGTSFRLLTSPNGSPVQTTPGTPTNLTIKPQIADVSYTETSKVGAEYPVQVGNGPVKIVNDYSAPGSCNIVADTTAKAITVTLPVTPTLGTTISITDNGNASTNKITIDPNNPAVTINGATGTIAIAGNYGSITLVSDGVAWTAIRTSFNGSTDVANNGAIDLQTAVSYFSTEGTETATLAAGYEGQVKTLAMRAYVGTMTVSVTNAGWKVSGGSGDIIFDQAGDSCTLQYINNKWYVIGNNGCAIDSTPAVVVGVPANATATGKAGSIAYDSSYMYICTATNTWRRVAIATW